MKVLYNSKTDFARKYAENVATALELECCDCTLSKKIYVKKDQVIFFSWLKNGKIVGYKNVSKYFDVKAIAVVGLSFYTEQLISEIKKNNAISDETPLFYMQGGFEPRGIGLINKINLKKYIKKINDDCQGQEKLTETNQIKAVLKNGGTFFSLKNAEPLIEWGRKELKIKPPKKEYKFKKVNKINNYRGGGRKNY